MEGVKPGKGSMGPVLRSPAWGNRSPGLIAKRSRSPGAPLSTSRPRGETQRAVTPPLNPERPKSPKLGGQGTAPDGQKSEVPKDLTKFQRELAAAIENLNSKRDMRRLAGMMVSNQDAEFPLSEMDDSGSTEQQDLIFKSVEEQFDFWKNEWSEETEEKQMMMGLPTFNFHLMSLLAAAMDTYWFSDGQQIQLVDWLRDMVSGAELRPLRLENEKLSKENTACLNTLTEYDHKLQMMKSSAGGLGGHVGIALVVIIILLALAMGHIATVHLMA